MDNFIKSVNIPLAEYESLKKENTMLKNLDVAKMLAVVSETLFSGRPITNTDMMWSTLSNSARKQGYEVALVASFGNSAPTIHFQKIK